MPSGYEKSLDYGGKEPSKLFMSLGLGLLYGIPLTIGAFVFAIWIVERSTSPTPFGIESIYWHDGDSGNIDGRAFRLANVDSPETGSVDAAIGAANCELERQLGYDAKEYVVELTLNAELVVTRDFGKDRYGRSVLELSANGKDVGESGVAAGYLRAWPHDGGKALVDKPDWCH